MLSDLAGPGVMGVSGCPKNENSSTIKKTAYEKRADWIEALAAKLHLPRAALDGPHPLALPVDAPPPPVQPFTDPDPFQELTYPSALKAKQGSQASC